MLSSHLTIEEQEAVEAELEELASAVRQGPAQEPAQEPAVELPTPPTSLPPKSVPEPSPVPQREEMLTETF